FRLDGPSGPRRVTAMQCSQERVALPHHSTSLFCSVLEIEPDVGTYSRPRSGDRPIALGRGRQQPCINSRTGPPCFLLDRRPSHEAWTRCARSSAPTSEGPPMQGFHRTQPRAHTRTHTLLRASALLLISTIAQLMAPARSGAHIL